MQHIRIKYSKGDELKFIGHLDLMRVFERAFRRTTLPISYSQGFNPKMRISYGTPLPLGVTSEAEYADIEMNGWIKPDVLKEELNKALPPGLKVEQANLIGPKQDSLMAQAEAVEYSAKMKQSPDGLKEKIEKILALKELVVDRKRKGEIRKIDIRPMIIEIGLEGHTLKMLVRSNSSGTAKPDEVLSSLGVEGARITRTRQFVKEKGVLKPL